MKVSNFLLFLVFAIIFSNNLLFAKMTSIDSQKTLINSNIIQKGLECANLVQKLGGIKSINILWLDKDNKNPAFYALINTVNTLNSNQKIFYICEQKPNTIVVSDYAEDAIKNLVVFDFYLESEKLFKDIFSLTDKSEEARKYIFSKLYLPDYNITRAQLVTAFAISKSEKIKKNSIVSDEIERENLKKERIKLEEEKKKLIAQNKELEKLKKKKIKKQKKIAKDNASSDTTGPSINISSEITVNENNYTLEGLVTDSGTDKIYLKIKDDTSENSIAIKKGVFKINKYSLTDEKIKFIATDQWGNETIKIVTVKIEIKEKKVVEKFEKLDPSKIKKIIKPNRIAIIFGIESYTEAPMATFANKDAKYFAEYVKRGFGVSPNNIKVLVDKDASLIKSFTVLSKWLPGKIQKDVTEVIIFFAGHGLATPNGKELFLLAHDSDPDLLSRTALSRLEMFDEISKLKPKSVIMFLDTCYSGTSRDDKTLLASARPVRILSSGEANIPENFTIFSASQLDQISSGFKKAKHGMFSYYLMKGLEGKADANNDKKITSGELLVYMDKNISQRALELGRQQNPSLAGDPDKILMSYR